MPKLLKATLLVNQWQERQHSRLPSHKVHRPSKLLLTLAAKTVYQLLRNAELIITIRTAAISTSTCAAISLELVAQNHRPASLTLIRCTSAAGVGDAVIIPTKLTNVQKELSGRTKLQLLSVQPCINTPTK
jgi:hypothetical protein